MKKGLQDPQTTSDNPDGGPAGPAAQSQSEPTCASDCCYGDRGLSGSPSLALAPAQAGVYRKRKGEVRSGIPRCRKRSTRVQEKPSRKNVAG